MIENYHFCRPLGWRRIKSLDLACDEQRQLQLWKANKNFRGRKASLVESYRYYLKSGKSQPEAYELACWTQFSERPKSGLSFNVDARTTWESVP